MFKFKSLTFIFLGLALSGCVQQTSNHTINKHKVAKARVDLALGYLNLKDYSKAKLNLDKALSYDPDYYLPNAALAYYYQLQGNIVKAESLYHKALQLDDTQGDVKNNYAVFLCSQGKYTQAYQQFKQALNTPDYYNQADTFENIALCALKEGNGKYFEMAVNELEKFDKKRANQLRSSN